MYRNKRKLYVIVVGMICTLLLMGCGLGKEVDTGVTDDVYALEIGGVNQWIRTTGTNNDNPILLVLHGGPGFVMMPIFDAVNNDLYQNYTVVNWDQRGAGKSYNEEIPEDSMTLNQLVRDANELTEYLKDKYKQEKIYVLGHSFGTQVGLELVYRYPENYYAYIGTGQVVDFSRNEQGSYAYAYENALKTSNDEAIEALSAVGEPDEEGRYVDDEGYEVTSKWVEYYGGSLHGKKSIDELYDLIFDNPIYKNDENAILAGYEFSQLFFEDTAVTEVDLFKERKVFEVPIYFLLGRNDYDTPSKLAEEYFNAIEAPNKELVWFEKSAHFPFYEEPEKFNKVMKEKILQEKASK